MKKLSLFFAAFMLVIFAGSISAQATEKASEDKIKILNVTSNKPIVRGVETEIIVEVEYDFTSGEKGMITIGFNTETPQGFRIYDSLKVNNGSGRIKLKAKVVPVDWEEKGNFSVLTTVARTPTPSFVSISATDTKVIEVEKN